MVCSSMAEQSTVNRQVIGSSPIKPAVRMFHNDSA